jgi:hypothetical protein
MGKEMLKSEKPLAPKEVKPYDQEADTKEESSRSVRR